MTIQNGQLGQAVFWELQINARSQTKPKKNIQPFNMLIPRGKYKHCVCSYNRAATATWQRININHLMWVLRADQSSNRIVRFLMLSPNAPWNVIPFCNVKRYTIYSWTVDNSTVILLFELVFPLFAHYFQNDDVELLILFYQYPIKRLYLTTFLAYIASKCVL